MNYQRILFATDLTQQSKQIGERARAISDHYQAALHILHVVEHPLLTYGVGFPVSSDLYLKKNRESEAQAALQKQAALLDVLNDHQHLRSGGVKTTVLEVAKEINADLILIGTHGPRGLGVLLGSRANAILHGATCDVLAIRST